MKKTILVAILATSTFFISCDINKTEKGELPSVDVDIDADEGELPEYEVNWADVDIATTTRTVEVPKLVVVMEEEEIEVPVIDVDMPDDEEKMERSIVVETEVTGTEHDIEIQQIRANQNRLFVISMLEKLDRDLGDQKMRIQDQVDLKAGDLDVVHYIIGARPNREFNNQYNYVATMDALPEVVRNAKVIYKR